MATAHLRFSQRMPLHPLNNSNTATVTVTATDSVLVSNPKQQYRILHSDERNLLNHQHPVTATATEKMETTALDLNSSLAEELNAVRMKTERLRLDKEKTEKMLKEREALLLLQMKEIEERGQIQRHLEIQVDRLFRLKELKSYSMRISPLKSLREKQRSGWNMNEVHSLELKGYESRDENPLQASTFHSLHTLRMLS
ncbi:hypothetical protein ES332_A02G003100v1 [Gossypium tomentosum]|uniref:Uncharacterized protein n=1 Tax=Gossypium tomentosum TaxID=34277 RepID=A0A5D2RBD4_GOSTO|nr:hypothetical protein ES332_A02G003100v1 [Gossypium tomentosum]